MLVLPDAKHNLLFFRVLLYLIVITIVKVKYTHRKYLFIEVCLEESKTHGNDQ